MACDSCVACEIEFVAIISTGGTTATQVQRRELRVCEERKRGVDRGGGCDYARREVRNVNRGGGRGGESGGFGR